jgi:hypothetical protein
MKVFFDTNVYVAEALLAGAAEQMVAASIAARWRLFCNLQVLDETERILVEKEVRLLAPVWLSDAATDSPPHGPGGSANVSACCSR